MNERSKARAGTVVAAVLATDGVLHAYWATGGVWPAPDRRALAHAVLNADDPALFRPRVVAPLAGVLGLAAATALARVDRLGRLGRRAPGSLLQAGTLAIAAGFATRGIAGLGLALGGGAATPFARLNRAFYTPACLALAVATVVAARAGRSGAGGGLPLPSSARGSGSREALAASGHGRRRPLGAALGTATPAGSDGEWEADAAVLDRRRIGEADHDRTPGRDLPGYLPWRTARGRGAARAPAPPRRRERAGAVVNDGGSSPWRDEGSLGRGLADDGARSAGRRRTPRRAGRRSWAGSVSPSASS